MTKIIPFDIDKTGIVKYRNGKIPIQWVELDKAAEVDFISVTPDDGTLVRHYENGRAEQAWSKEWDLVMEVPVKEEIYYANVYKNDAELYMHPTLEKAKANSHGKPNKSTFKFTFIEGEKPKAEFIE